MTPISSTPNKGNRTNGIREVMGRGNASVAHQTPINKKTASVIWPSVLRPSILPKDMTAKKRIIPKNRPVLRTSI